MRYQVGVGIREYVTDVQCIGQRVYTSAIALRRDRGEQGFRQTDHR